jgi:hypothetical protein
MSTKQLSNLLNPNGNGELGDIIQRAREMGELTGALANALPAELAGSLVAANLKDSQELVLICASSAWASRLRFEESTLIETARTLGLDVDKVSVRVARVDYNSDHS